MVEGNHFPPVQTVTQFYTVILENVDFDFQSRQKHSAFGIAVAQSRKIHRKIIKQKNNFRKQKQKNN